MLHRDKKFNKTLQNRKWRAKFLKWYTGEKHYVLYDYKDRIIVVNTLMLEKFKKKRLLKRNWDKHILYETK
jgi:menaquinone-dependent protoporphyrinogen IX oxidase